MNTPQLASQPPNGKRFGDFLHGLASVAVARSTVCELEEAIGFLQALDDAGRHNLVAIDPASGAVTGRTFEPGDWPAIRQWIEAHAGRSNLYYSVNEPAAGAPHDKLKKESVGAIRALVGDVDPAGKAPLDEERRDIARKAEIIQTTAYAPTITLDSGSGCQFVWKLDKKLDPADHRQWAEDQAKALRSVIGGDAVQNIDRIMRLPGTLNIPDAKKRAKGRVERMARIMHRTDRTHGPDELRAAVRPISGSAADPATVNQAHLVGDTDLVRRAVEALPNTIELFPHRADMIRVGMAIHAASADDPEAGREAFHEWASRWERGDYDRDEVHKAWESFRGPHAIGAPWLYSQARMHGGEAGAAVHASYAVAKYFDKDAAAGVDIPAEAAPSDASGMFGAEPRSADIVDIFGHGDPAELGTPPAGSLPPVLAAWARTEARRKGVSEAFAAASAVAAASSAIGSSLRLQVKQHDTGWTEPASLWVTLIAPPGSAKSAIIGAAAAPLRELDTQYRREWAPRHTEWQKKEAAHRRGRKDATDPGPEPICRRAVLDNFTSEKALRVFSENPRGVICTPDELVGMLGSFGAYKKSGDGDRALMLRFFDGAEAMSDRVGGGTLYAESALLGVLASSQPDKIRELADGLGGDGLLQRFLFVMHDGRERTGLDEAPDAEACGTYRQILRSLATAEHMFSDPIRLEPAAAGVREEGLKKLRSLKWLFGTSPAFAGHVEKFDKFLARLILTFHCVEETGRRGSVDPAAPVSTSTVEMAVEFAAFLMRHSLEFYREFIGASDIATEAHWVANFLLAHPELKFVDKRRLYDAQKSFRGSRGHKRCIATMCELETAGWVRAVPRKSAADKDIWTVNPAIHHLFSERARREQARRQEIKTLIGAAGAARQWVNGERNEEDAERQKPAVSAFD